MVGSDANVFDDCNVCTRASREDEIPSRGASTVAATELGANEVAFDVIIVDLGIFGCLVRAYVLTVLRMYVGAISGTVVRSLTRSTVTNPIDGRTKKAGTTLNREGAVCRADHVTDSWTGLEVTDRWSFPCSQLRRRGRSMESTRERLFDQPERGTCNSCKSLTSSFRPSRFWKSRVNSKQPILSHPGPSTLRPRVLECTVAQYVISQSA